jgi:hypothetical protein
VAVTMTDRFRTSGNELNGFELYRLFRIGDEYFWSPCPFVYGSAESAKRAAEMMVNEPRYVEEFEVEKRTR